MQIATGPNSSYLSKFPLTINVGILFSPIGGLRNATSYLLSPTPLREYLYQDGFVFQTISNKTNSGESQACYLTWRYMLHA